MTTAALPTARDAATTTPPTTHGTAQGPAWKRRLVVTLFLAPTIIGIGVFTLLPIIASIGLAFFRWDIITNPEFAGLDNFADVAVDPTVRRSFLNTIAFVVVAVTLQIAVSLGLAVLVAQRMPSWLRTFFRSVFFFPLILSAASVSIVMRYLFNEDFGVVNWFLSLVGLPGVAWLTSGWSAAVVVLVYVWQQFGFTFLLFVGGLAAIPNDVYEASAIDGATGWRQFRTITLPLVSPTMLVACVMSVISALQIFDQPWVLTRGGPGDSTRTAVMVIYESAFRQLEFGRASAVGVVLMALIMGVTALQFRLSRRFVFYQ
ncbi:binding-protein-dependent transport systems inner membrane component [Beutenbergia cavernae DSM 12333]|uniref:Binding-protein-dependent transport systems inner membrane component n=1 Tax=Beutenbergia cavernae (strain ATCC BAA-8 / DSM 12333 / CCUG 43141 / JCM 11478 / NBRC 16432 / NCIMB 13614 / HKI 0122) TaxID=471853 RepID=C5BZB7_BEUC1|nr:sugar ABC transporter permease [Beutenbergia cavernae]ACQ79089.1 binding-protein-dependent transport systems inner membrane component [Beutenbergia cavernae DSM 12333]